jgi:hypothetical protein
MGVERRESPFSTRQSHVTIIQTGYLYYSVSPHLYRILYYTHREKIERKKMEKAFLPYFFRLSPNSQR